MATKSETRGNGGEIHQTASSEANVLTTNQGLPVADDQNSLRVGERGPTLLEDMIFREKITHFDHERIPERVVHARGYGARGYFVPNKSHADITRAKFLQDPAVRTPVFVRFSTVAGNEGSADTVRDVRGFAVKFYTQEGNFDLVGNNIPVFFIQDAMKFPDLVHSVKQEPDRAFPQAASAHDTFWDFVSLTPESTHMLLWQMSDRTIPRSFRMMEGFGVHTFRLVDAQGKSVFVKFHWRPKLGTFSLIWDEALKISGADPDFHRRDLWEAIGSGDFPEYELGVQVFDQAQADGFDFDVLDATKIVPEEIIPIRVLGTMVLNENVENFFAETEQVAFCPSHIVPGIDFSDDPLLQGRLFSYLDTQLSRLGSPNFHEIPVNKPKCPMRNFQRDGHMRTDRQPGRVAYEPNTMAPDSPREDPKRGFTSFPATVQGPKMRIRAASFADHYTQATLFWKSMTPTEQAHIVGAFAFELGKVETVAIRTRVLGQLDNVDAELGKRVADALGMSGQADKVAPAVPARAVTKTSPALSILGKAPASIKGRKIAVLVSDGTDAAVFAAVKKAVEAEGAKISVIAPKIGGVKTADGKPLAAHHALSGAPSVLFDAVVIAVSDDGAKMLVKEAAAVDFIRDAFAHLKTIGHVPTAAPLFKAAGIDLAADAGVTSVAGNGVAAFVTAAKQHRVWDREPNVRSLG